jgi:hypothetical protein
MELTTEQLGAFAHAEEAEVSVGLGFGDAFRVEGAAIVADFEQDVAVMVMEPDPGAAGPGVFLNVLQGFLGEAEKMGEVIAVQKVDGHRLELDVQSHAGAFAESFGVFFQRGDQAEVVEEGGTHVAGEGANIGQRAFELVAQIGQLLPEPCGDLFVFGQADAVGRGGEDLRDVVVKLAADDLLLFLA